MPLYVPGGSSYVDPYEAAPQNIPTVAYFTSGWLNQGTSTATDVASGVLLAPQANDQAHALLMPAPATPFDVYCRVEQNVYGGNTTSIMNAFSGIILKDDSDTECIIFSNFYQKINGSYPANRVAAFNFNTAAGIITSTILDRFIQSPALWLRVNVTTTTITFYMSIDGKNWYETGNTLISSFIDSVGSVGIAAYSNANCSLTAHFTQFGFAAP